jgi:hypothetical protein
VFFRFALADIFHQFRADGNMMKSAVQLVVRVRIWVKTVKQTTDGHLAQLAKANGAILATLDRGIPGAFQIP